MRAQKRVLVVDDDESIREFVAVALQEEGYLVDVAADGQAALERARSSPPDLILLDLWMPKLDGTAFLAAYQQLTPRAPVVVFAASSDTEAATRQVGVVAFLAKPVELDDLIATVARWTQ